MEQARVPKSVFMFEGANISDMHDDDAVWVTVILNHHISPADSDERIMQFVVDQIKVGEVVIGPCSLSLVGAQCISLGLPVDRISRYILGALCHADALAAWWLEQIREGVIQLDRSHIFGI